MLLEVQDLCKSYDQGENIEKLEVLKNINLSLNAGESLSVLGPSGEGKTTLLNCLGALDSFDSGTIVLDNQDYKSLTQKQLSFLRNQQIGFVFQLHHLLPQFNLWDNILLPCLAFPENKNNLEETQKRAEDWIKKLQLSHRIHAFPYELSGGERQRGAVIRALINNPKLLLADEPTGNLDFKLSETLVNLLLDVSRESNAALIMVTHSEKLAKKTQQLLRLSQGNFKTPGGDE